MVGNPFFRKPAADRRRRKWISFNALSVKFFPPVVPNCSIQGTPTHKAVITKQDQPFEIMHADLAVRENDGSAFTTHARMVPFGLNLPTMKQDLVGKIDRLFR